MGRYKFFIVILLLFISVAIAALAHQYYMHRYDRMITRVSVKYKLDPALVRALIYEESYFDQQARSTAGAVGLMQVTEVIIREYARVTGEERLARAFPEALQDRDKAEIARLSNDDLLIHPEVNIHLGCWYLDQLMKRYAHLEEPLPIVLASYNAGPSNAQRWQQRLRQNNKSARFSTDSFIEQIDYPETKRYVRSVMVRYKKYKELQDDNYKIGWLIDFAR